MVVKPKRGEVETQSSVEKSELKELKKPSPENRSESNLNRLDPVTKIIHGVRQRKWLFLAFLLLLLLFFSFISCLSVTFTVT